MSIFHGNELIHPFDQLLIVFIERASYIDSVCSVSYCILALFYLRLGMCIDGSGVGFKRVSYSHGFQSGQRVACYLVFRLEVEWVFLHTLHFLRINVLVDRRLVAYNGRGYRYDANYKVSEECT